jgi:hypothetical protein
MSFILKKMTNRCAPRFREADVNRRRRRDERVTRLWAYAILAVSTHARRGAFGAPTAPSLFKPGLVSGGIEL